MILGRARVRMRERERKRERAHVNVRVCASRAPVCAPLCRAGEERGLRVRKSSTNARERGDRTPRLVAGRGRG